MGTTVPALFDILFRATIPDQITRKKKKKKIDNHMISDKFMRVVERDPPIQINITYECDAQSAECGITGLTLTSRVACVRALRNRAETCGDPGGNVRACKKNGRERTYLREIT